MKQRGSRVRSIQVESQTVFSEKIDRRRNNKDADDANFIDLPLLVLQGALDFQGEAALKFGR